MIRDYEIGAVFAIVDDATGPLRKILEAVREVTKAIKLARGEMAGFGAAITPGIGGAVAEVNTLAGAWTRAAESSVAAAKVMRDAAASAARSARSAAAATSVPGVAAPGIGRQRLGSQLGMGGGAHLSGPGVGIPGGSHLRLGGNAAMVGAGLAGWGLYEAGSMEAGTHWLNYHLGRKDSPQNNAQLRKIIEEGMVSTGMPLHDVIKAATDEARLMKGTPGVDAVGALPEFLRAAGAEALAKDVSLQEAMKSIIGMAHQVKAYSVPEIKKLFPAFAYLSTANPATLGQMETSFSYAVPLLQSGADVDPITTMLLGTALSTAGVKNSKSGTWIREMVRRSMPTGKAEHDNALKQLGLLDENGKPTWFTDGRPDPIKALEIAGPRAAAMAVPERLIAEHEVFGTQGSGGFSVLADPKVLERIKELRKELGSEEFQNRYGSILEDYTGGTAKGLTRSTMQSFNVALLELGTTALPVATAAVRGLSAALGWITGGHQTKEDKSFKPNWMENLHGLMPWSGASPLPQKQSFPGGAMTPQHMNFLQGPPNQPTKTQTAFSLNVDGRVLAQTVIEQMESLSEHATSAPSYNGLQAFNRADGGMAAV
jgi:hypothetical protein